MGDVRLMFEELTLHAIGKFLWASVVLIVKILLFYSMYRKWKRWRIRRKDQKVAKNANLL